MQAQKSRHQYVRILGFIVLRTKKNQQRWTLLVSFSRRLCRLLRHSGGRDNPVHDLLERHIAVDVA